MGWGRAAVTLAALAFPGCVVDLGPFSLSASEGRVVDADSGAPIAGAEVFEWHRGVGSSDAAQPVYVARWTTTDADGRFTLPQRCAPSARMWIWKTYPPDYAFYHPDYGLQRGARQAVGAAERDAGWQLLGSRARSEAARRDLAPYCRGEYDDAGARHLAAIACDAEQPRRSAP
ncbi:MAG: carboxypeptidase-like regulatory domain-containing protein [Myxococcota bacterium]